MTLDVGGGLVSEVSIQALFKRAIRKGFKILPGP